MSLASPSSLSSSTVPLASSVSSESATSSPSSLSFSLNLSANLSTKLLTKSSTEFGESFMSFGATPGHGLEQEKQSEKSQWRRALPLLSLIEGLLKHEM